MVIMHLRIRFYYRNNQKYYTKIRQILYKYNRCKPVGYIYKTQYDETCAVDGRFGNWSYIITWLRTWLRLRPIAEQCAIVRFGNWSAWGACSVTCGNGTHSRQRQCIGPEHGGLPCVGDTEETQACFDRPCPGMKPTVTWSETVGLRIRPVWDQRNRSCLGLGLASCGLGLGLAVLVLFCETRSCNARCHNNLEGHSILKYYL